MNTGRLKRLARRGLRAGMLLMLGMAVRAQHAAAQSGGALGKMRQAAESTGSELRGMADPVINILMVITGIIGLINIVSVVRKFMAGDQDAGKKLGQWIGGIALVFILLGVAKSLFF